MTTTVRTLAPLCLLAALVGACDASRPKAAVVPSPVLVVSGGRVSGLAWLPDGASVVTAEEGGSGPSPDRRCPSPQRTFRLRLHRAGGADAGRPMTDDPRLFQPATARVSPDGRLLAVAGFCDEEFVGVVGIVTVGESPARVRMLPGGKDVTYGTPYLPTTLGWVSKSELLVLRIRGTGGASDDFVGEAVVVDVTTMRGQVLVSDPELRAAQVVPGRGFLVEIGKGADMRVEFVDAHGRRTTVANGQQAEVSPDGATVAVWDTDGRVRLSKATSSGGSRPLAVTGGDVTLVTWSPDAARLLAAIEVAGTDTTSYRAYVARGDGSHVTSLPLHDYGGGRLVWSPDGTRVMYATGGEYGQVYVAAVPRP